MLIPAIQHPGPKRWTREELRALIEAGFTDLERYELFEGQLIDKTGQDRPHVHTVHKVADWLRLVFSSPRVTQESPINLRPYDNPTHRPEPDSAVLRRPIDEFKRADPDPSDIVLLVEVADTSLAFDLGPKAERYAQAGIPEYWVIDLAGRRLIAHRDPGPEHYRSVVAYAEHETVAPLAAPHRYLQPGSVLP